MSAAVPGPGDLPACPSVKDTSAQAVEELRALGLTPVLLAGDNAAVAAAVAREVGIDPEHVHADVLPQDKVDVVRSLQESGRVVAMVGDGVNDAAALAQADLGLAIGTGSDVGIEASDLTLVRGDLRVAADAIRLARRTLRTIRGNLFWVFGYDITALPLAAAGLLDPMIAGGALALSSVFVVTDSLRLLGLRRSPTADPYPASPRRPPVVPTPFAAGRQVALWSRRTPDGCPVAAAAESRPASAGPATIADETGGTTYVGGP